MPLSNIIPSVMREQTIAFIEYRPETVTLTRFPKVSDGMGGVSQGTPSPLSPQQMRLVPAATIAQNAPVRVTTSGQTVTPSWFLVGEHDADIEIGDTTTVRNHKLEVIFISDLPDERIVAECWENV
jgi:hypothetical protein